MMTAYVMRELKLPQTQWNEGTTVFPCLVLLINDLSLPRLLSHLTVSFVHAMNLHHFSANQKHVSNERKYLTQPAFTCLNLTIDALEQGVKYVQSMFNKNTRTTSF